MSLSLTACSVKKDNWVNLETQSTIDGNASSKDELLIYDSTDLYEYEDYKDGITITSFNNYDLVEYDKIIVPSYIDGKKVVGIGSLEKEIRVFAYAYGEVIIPDTVQFIGTYAFFYARYVVKISGCENCKTIGSAAFGYCEKLEDITFINNVDNVADNAFDGTSFKYK